MTNAFFDCVSSSSRLQQPRDSMIDATSRAKNAVDDEKMVNARRIQIANAILIGNRAVPFHANAIVTDDA